MSILIVYELVEESEPAKPAQEDGFNYRLIVTYRSGTRGVFGGRVCHDTKCLAGHLFRWDENVKSVCVTDINGDTFLYLHKDHPERSVDISSCYAIYG